MWPAAPTVPELPRAPAVLSAPLKRAAKPTAPRKGFGISAFGGPGVAVIEALTEMTFYSQGQIGAAMRGVF